MSKLLHAVLHIIIKPSKWKAICTRSRNCLTIDIGYKLKASFEGDYEPKFPVFILQLPKCDGPYRRADLPSHPARRAKGSSSHHGHHRIPV